MSADILSEFCQNWLLHINSLYSAPGESHSLA